MKEPSNDSDILSAGDIARIKQRMTPVFVEFSGHKAGMGMRYEC